MGDNYSYVLTFSSDHERAPVDLLKIILTLAPYMVDNVELEAVTLTPDNYYKVV